jgi:nitroimidazol reductase NimA-like FMN-containing flavoprotein (pyridoxamine 5'-phosphate oxidase superfamily)
VTRDDAEVLAKLQSASYSRAGQGLRSSWPERRALDADGLLDLLTHLRYAVLATARPDGRAHAAPVGFLVADGAFWIGTVEGRRLRNLRARPWASLVVMEGEAERAAGDGVAHRAVTVEGPTTLHEGDALAAAYAGLDARWIERHGHSPDWAAALVQLRPERVFSYAAGESL